MSRSPRKTKKIERANLGPTWTPIRNGNVFCSSACGRGCTWREHTRAIQQAKNLLEKMKSPGWRINVHENLGWHFSIVKEASTGPWTLEVSQLGDKYHCGFFGGTPMEVYVPEYYADPNQAVEAQLQRIRNIISTWKKALSICEQGKAKK